jgi:hypothetical protein
MEQGSALSKLAQTDLSLEHARFELTLDGTQIFLTIYTRFYSFSLAKYGDSISDQAPTDSLQILTNSLFTTPLYNSTGATDSVAEYNTN